MFTAQEQQKLREIDAVIARGPYQDSWDSLQNYRPPRWFCDAKVRHLHPLGRLRRAGL